MMAYQVYDSKPHARSVQLPGFTMFELLGALVHQSAFKAVVVIVYRSSSQAVSGTFIDEPGDLLARSLRRSSSLATSVYTLTISTVQTRAGSLTW
jgi:hypothetical protein